MAEATENKIDVVSPSGQFGTIDPSDLTNALALQYKPVTKDQVKEELVRQQYGIGPENELKAFVQGATESVPYVGGYLEKGFGVTPEAVSARKKYFPAAHLLGAASGIAGQMAIPVGPLKAITAAGEGVEGLGLAGEGATGVLSALQGGVNKGLGSALSAGLYESGKIYNEHVLGDPDLAAQSVASRIGTAALWGGSVGALFGGIASGEGKKAFDEAESELGTGATKAASEIPEEADAMSQIKGIMGMGKTAFELGKAVMVPKVAAAELAWEGIKHTIEGGTAGEFLAEKFGSLKPIEDALLKYKSTLTTGTNAIFKSPAVPIVTAELSGQNKEETRKDRIDNYNEIISQLRSLAQQPEMLQKRLQDTTDHLYPHAPQITAALQATAVRSVSFLNSKLPKEPPPTLLQKSQDPSQAQISDFNRYYRPVEDPLSAIKDIKNGTLTHQTVEAISTVHPQLYQDMQREILNKVAGIKDPSIVPYRTKLMLSVFLNHPLDNSMTPQSILSNQMTINAPSKQSGENTAAPRHGKSTQKGLAALGIASRVLTPMQKSSQRIE